MSEELKEIVYADKAKEAVKLSDKKRVILTGHIQSKEILFDGSGDLEIETEITGGDISKTTIEITELSGVDEEEIQSKEITGKLLYKIKNKFEDIEKGLENKLEKTATATSAEKLSEGKNISLVGNVKGTVAFDGSKDVNIETEITGGDIKDTVVSFTESLTKEEINSGETTSTIVGKIKKNFNDVNLHMQNKNNPHEISKEQLGLENVDNTSDLEKPISNATQSVLDEKLDKTGNAASASNADMLDGKESSYYAPIENPSFEGIPRAITADIGTNTKQIATTEFVQNSLKIKKDIEYTYIVNSNKALQDWANNESENDYTSVLIKKGIWKSSKGIDLTKTKTKVIVGETDSQLEFNCNGCALSYYNTIPESHDFYIYNVYCKIVSSGNDGVTAFNSCINLTHCTAVTITEKGHNAHGFVSCSNLNNCYGFGESLKEISSKSVGVGFYLCKNLVNCTGEGIGDYNSFGFSECKYLTNCNSKISSNTGENCCSFNGCKYLTNCTGSAYHVVFNGCQYLTNCEGYGFFKAFNACNNLTNCIGEGKGSKYSQGFYACTNLNQCYGYGYTIATSSLLTDGTAVGFHHCSSLTNCKGKGETINNINGYGFAYCKELISCKSEANSYNFSECEDMIYNKAIGNIIGVKYNKCYADSAKQYPISNNPNGGFNI